MPDWRAIRDAIGRQGVTVGSNAKPRPVAGGDINAAWKLESETTPLFLKTGAPSAGDMFAAEADGLAELAGANAIRVPKVLGVGTTESDAFIAIEWIDFDRPTGQCERKLGEQLAQMHRSCAERFGWRRDNTIGLTPQHNDWSKNWIEFYREHRLRFQLELAERNGCSDEIRALGETLGDGLAVFFEDYAPVPSLLHGDLWGGNRACAHGEPVIFDPATYYGDRETDLAMTRLFGGFGSAFYDAYEAAWPTAAGAGARTELYQLYHLLNHLNLFGGAYESRVTQVLRSLCRALR